MKASPAFVVALLVSAPLSHAQNATCDSLLQAIDQSQRMAALADATSSEPGRNPQTQLLIASNEMASINANLSLAVAHKCKLPDYPLSIPGPYKKAVGACRVAMIDARSKSAAPRAESECIISNWQRDPK